MHVAKVELFLIYQSDQKTIATNVGLLLLQQGVANLLSVKANYVSSW